MPALSAAAYRGVLELVAEALRRANPEFPDGAVTGFLRNMFHAEFAGAGQVDFRDTASRTWADSPNPIPVVLGGFHNYAVGHPLARTYRRTSEPIPLRLSDVVSLKAAPSPYGGTSMNRILTIPLAITPHHVSSLALMRGGWDFTASDLCLARQLQPVLSGLYALRDRILFHGPSAPCADLGILLTARELAVLDLMAGGLIATAIARQLGISPRTVSKHIENIYRKLGTHDRTSAVLRGQDLGIIRPGSEPALQFPLGAVERPITSRSVRQRLCDVEHGLVCIVALPANAFNCRVSSADWRPGRVYFLTLLDPSWGQPDSGPYRQVGQSLQP